MIQPPIHSTVANHLFLLIVCSAIVVGGPAVRAGDDSACCVCQTKTCKVTVEKEEVDVACFDVECVDVCIPPVRFWWERGPLRQCGKIRTVKQLVVEKHPKQVCTYDWEVISICSRCYRDVHRLRCHQLGVAATTPAAEIGLPPAQESGHVEVHIADLDLDSVPHPTSSGRGTIAYDDPSGGRELISQPVVVGRPKQPVRLTPAFGQE
jgi:hypothetical protein